MVGDRLDALGIPAEGQAKIGRWCVDYYIEPLLLVVEVDGAFWHSSPEVMDRDRRKDEYMANADFSIIRIDADDAVRDIEAAVMPVVERWQQFTGKTARLEGTKMTFDKKRKRAAQAA